MAAQTSGRFRAALKGANVGAAIGLVGSIGVAYWYGENYARWLTRDGQSGFSFLIIGAIGALVGALLGALIGAIRGSPNDRASV
jgi:hypothetical protein